MKSGVSFVYSAFVPWALPKAAGAAEMAKRSGSGCLDVGRGAVAGASGNGPNVIAWQDHRRGRNGTCNRLPGTRCASAPGRVQVIVLRSGDLRRDRGPANDVAIDAHRTGRASRQRQTR